MFKENTQTWINVCPNRKIYEHNLGFLLVAHSNSGHYSLFACVYIWSRLAPSHGRLRAAHVYLGINKDIVTHKHTHTQLKHTENELKCFNFEAVCDHQTSFVFCHTKITHKPMESACCAASVINAPHCEHIAIQMAIKHLLVVI